jgi:predicted lipoprotein with Yx(FWY)xxD motif
MKKRNTIIIVSVSFVLVLTVGLFAFLNAGNASQKKILQEETLVLISADGKTLGTINMDIIEKTGPVDFSANLDTSDSEPQQHLYTGVLLNDILKKLGINVLDYSSLIAKAVDGYTVAYTTLEIMEEDNIYLAVKKDGKPLGTKNTGGSGPYQIIARKDAFSQRWCKFVVEIELK